MASPSQQASLFQGGLLLLGTERFLYRSWWEFSAVLSSAASTFPEPSLGLSKGSRQLSHGF